MCDSPWTSYANANIDVVDGEREYSVKLNPSSAKDGSYNSPRMLNIQVGNLVGTSYSISKISVEEVK